MDLNASDPVLIGTRQLSRNHLDDLHAPRANATNNSRRNSWFFERRNIQQSVDILELCRIFLLNFYLKHLGPVRLFEMLQREHERYGLATGRAFALLAGCFLFTWLLQSDFYHTLMNLFVSWLQVLTSWHLTVIGKLLLKWKQNDTIWDKADEKGGGEKFFCRLAPLCRHGWRQCFCFSLTKSFQFKDQTLIDSIRSDTIRFESSRSMFLLWNSNKERQWAGEQCKHRSGTLNFVSNQQLWLALPINLEKSQPPPPPSSSSLSTTCRNGPERKRLPSLQMADCNFRHLIWDYCKLLDRITNLAEPTWEPRKMSRINQIFASLIDIFEVVVGFPISLV